MNSCSYVTARTFIGLEAFGGARHMTPEGVALALNECGAVCKGVNGGEEDWGGEGEGEGGVDDHDTARRRYAEQIVRRMIEDGKEMRERKHEETDDGDR